MNAWESPSAEDRRTQRPTIWDELGYLHNHAIRPDGTLGRYHSNCSGCDLREDENP
jgi:hypothetical protein